jgi:hypothetical protein
LFLCVSKGDKTEAAKLLRDVRVDLKPTHHQTNSKQNHGSQTPPPPPLLEAAAAVGRVNV